jgi:PKD repeat protein
MRHTVRFSGLALIVLAVFLLAGAVPVFAYGSLDYFYNSQLRTEHWGNTSGIPWWIDQSSYSNFYSETQASFDTWEAVTYTDVTFQYQGTTPIVMDADDGVNVVSYNSNYAAWGSVLGFTINYTTQSTGEIHGFDVIMNPKLRWSTDGTPRSNQYELRSVLVHELGHAQGLAHSVVAEATMYPFGSPGTTAPSTLEDDDLISHSLLYGNASFPGPYAKFTGQVVRGGTGNPVAGACVHSFPPSAQYYSDNVTSVITYGDGLYELYAPAGDYILRLDPLDGDPSAFDPSRISEALMAVAETDFPAEWYNSGDNNCEDATLATVYSIASGQTLSGFDFVTNENCAGQAPVADFSGSPLSGGAPLNVSFTDLSTGSPTSWSWDFGDGIGTSTAQNPSYTYSNAGTYSVTLTVSNSYGSDSQQKVDYITVTSGGQMYVHVTDISVTRESAGGPNRRGVASVTVADQFDTPVAGATVFGFFNAPNTSTKTGTTGSGGTATITSDKTRSAPGDWCFEVTDVQFSGATYDAGANLVTSACESGPVFKGIVAVPEAYQLQQNVPNPFNPTTDITFALPTASQVRLQVFDVTGRNVCNLVDGYLAAGPHTVTWNSTDASGRKVASGVYFYRLQTSEFSQTRKMLLLK